MRGGKSEDEASDSDEGRDVESANRRKEQSDTALSNVRKGYGGPDK